MADSEDHTKVEHECERGVHARAFVCVCVCVCMCVARGIRRCASMLNSFCFSFICDFATYLVVDDSVEL
jgi:hypothetical protein